MRITTSKTRDQFPLSQKKIVKKTLTDIVGSVFSIIVLFFVLQSIIGVYLKLWIPETDTYLIGARITIIALAIIMPTYSYTYQRMFFARYFYDFTDNYVVIRKGVITPREITIPYERIQDVYVDQDLFDKLFGLYDVHISSATITSGIEAHIDGLERDAAHGLRDVLLQRIKERMSYGRLVSPSV